ncbi:MAG: response regulator, partial [Candidatus Marinimicrobia bacterium]|nr:response regulator [Candidatus Neomarinimicrobiota bacterium]
MNRLYKILVVEDMEPFAKFVKMRLESLGYTVVGIADNGPLAVSMAEELKPDLIMMDITLNTSMTGFEAASNILNW